MTLDRKAYLNYFFMPGGLDVYEDWDELNRKFGLEEFQVPLSLALKQITKHYHQKGLLEIQESMESKLQ